MAASLGQSAPHTLRLTVDATWMGIAEDLASDSSGASLISKRPTRVWAGSGREMGPARSALRLGGQPAYTRGC